MKSESKKAKQPKTLKMENFYQIIESHALLKLSCNKKISLGESDHPVNIYQKLLVTIHYQIQI